MKKFILYYWFGIALLFTVFYWEHSPFSLAINNIQTNITAYLTSLSLPENIMEAHKIFIDSSYTLVIEKSCNGLIPYLFFLASIIAFPSTLLHKVKWVLMGYLIISAMNIFRIWLVTQFVLQEKSNFSFAHDYLGNALLILTGLMLFIVFIKTRTPNKVTETKSIQNIQVAL